MGKLKNLWTYPLFTPLNAFLRHFPKEFLKNKNTSILYFFMIYPNLVSKLVISYFEILLLYRISQTSLTSMGSIVDAGNLKFWKNYPKVILKKNIITVNCVVIVGPPYWSMDHWKDKSSHTGTWTWRFTVIQEFVQQGFNLKGFLRISPLIVARELEFCPSAQIV